MVNHNNQKYDNNNIYKRNIDFENKHICSNFQYQINYKRNENNYNNCNHNYNNKHLNDHINNKE